MLLFRSYCDFQKQQHHKGQVSNDWTQIQLFRTHKDRATTTRRIIKYRGACCATESLELLDGGSAMPHRALNYHHFSVFVNEGTAVLCVSNTGSNTRAMKN